MENYLSSANGPQWGTHGPKGVTTGPGALVSLCSWPKRLTQTHPSGSSHRGTTLPRDGIQNYKHNFVKTAWFHYKVCTHQSRSGKKSGDRRTHRAHWPAERPDRRTLLPPTNTRPGDLRQAGRRDGGERLGRLWPWPSALPLFLFRTHTWDQEGPGHPATWEATTRNKAPRDGWGGRGAAYNEDGKTAGLPQVGAVSSQPWTTP